MESDSAPRGPEPSPAEPPHLAPGQFLAGKYVLVREIGRGGMGVVWHAERPDWRGAPVALKVVRLPGTRGAIERFEREVVLAAQLRSEHVVQILDHGVDTALGVPFIAMHLLPGESLDRRLSRLKTLSPGEVALLMTHVGRALSRAHAQGIIHRDLKPGNVFLVDNHGEIVAKVLDFGLAKAIDGELLESRPLTIQGNAIGTPGYMSPEQLRGEANHHFGDLWSLAVIACECLVGKRPFRPGRSGERPVPSRLGAVPPGFDAWFAKATHPDIERRYQRVDELVSALCEVCRSGRKDIPRLEYETFSHPRLSTVTPITRPPVTRSNFARRSMIVFGAGLGLALAGLGLNAYFFVRQSVRVPITTTATETSHALTPSPAAEPAVMPDTGPEQSAPTPELAPSPARSDTAEASTETVPAPATAHRELRPSSTPSTKRTRSGFPRKRAQRPLVTEPPAPAAAERANEVLDEEF